MNNGHIVLAEIDNHENELFCCWPFDQNKTAFRLIHTMNEILFSKKKKKKR